MNSLLLSLLALTASIPSAFGLAGKLPGPEFGQADIINAFKKNKAAELLAFMQKDLEFIEGDFINRFSHQRFAGSSEKVGEFLHLLQQASADPITVEFQDLGKDQKLAFILHQASSKNSVTVNVSRKDFRLTDFKAFLPGSHLLKAGGDKTLQFLQSLRLDKKVEDPEKIGREMAERDFGSGTYRVFHFGKPWSQGKPLIDDASGLKVTIAAGCTVGGDTVKLISAYNAQMRQKAAGTKR